MDLQKDFSEQTLTLSADAQGENIATLVSSKRNEGNRDTVLYVHGFIDYFFHPHVAQAFHDKGMDFYALDLRKYGRSILPHQKPNYCEDLSEYFEELDASIKIIKSLTNKKIYLLAHSTGCTITAYYMNKGNRKDDVSALILNSPFLEMPQSKALTNVMVLAGKALTKIKPMAKLPRPINHVYPKTLHKNFAGEWDFDLTKKPVEGFQGYFKWALAVERVHKFLQTKSAITVPVLVMHASKSAKPKRLNKKAKTSDIILNVAHMKKYGKKLGKKVTLLKVKNGLHDLFLSAPKVRKKALTDMFNWIESI